MLKGHDGGEINTAVDSKTIKVSACFIKCIHEPSCPKHDFEDGVCRCNTVQTVEVQ